jgi:quercetin dioxygenase-like cupin family protein
MNVTSFENAPKVPSGLNARKMYTSDTLDVMHLYLAPGEEIKVHVNPNDVVFCVILGSVTLTAIDTQIGLKTYDVIEIPAGTERGLLNETNSDTRVLVLKKLG